MIKILFVCMGNICRSPTAEGVFRRLVEKAGLTNRILVDSAGTHGYHVGEAPDSRTQRAAQARGLDISTLRARKVVEEDLRSFDLVLAMDKANLEFLRGLCPQERSHRLRLMMSYSRHFHEEEVPDPYYGLGQGFDLVLDMLEDAAQGLLDSLRRELGLTPGAKAVGNRASPAL